VPKIVMTNETRTVMQQMQREVPKVQYDSRTVMVPKSIVEDYAVMETRLVAIQIPVNMQRHKWITIPREISIPRPMIEKRIITKTVPKVIQVEEQYEVEVGITETETYEMPQTTTVQIPIETEEFYTETIEVQVAQVRIHITRQGVMSQGKNSVNI